MIHADRFNLTIPATGTPSEREESPSPPTPHSATPPPRHSATSFLHSLLISNFDLPALAATLSPEELLALTTDPDLLAQLENLLTFSSTCLELRQVQIRTRVLAQLASVLEAAEDPIEKRRAATALLRATDPRVARRTPRAADATDAEESDDQDTAPPRLPRPSVVPNPALTAAEVIDKLRAALSRNDQPDTNSGLATLAAFCDHDAALNNEPLPTDDDEEILDTLADSDLARCTGPTLGMSAPTITLDPASDTAAVAFHLATKFDGAPFDLRLTLARHSHSRWPNCYLITDLTVRPDASSA